MLFNVNEQWSEAVKTAVPKLFREFSGGDVRTPMSLSRVSIYDLTFVQPDPPWRR